MEDQVWMWLVGGACAIAVTLVGAIGGFMINSIVKLRDEVKSFRIEFAENKGETVTWPKFSEAKREMEKERHSDIKIAISEHMEHHHA